MKRNEFFKTLFGVPVALGLSKQEIIEIPAPLTHCKDCDTKLFAGKCLNTKYCQTCKTWKHFPEERCEICGNGYINFPGGVSFADVFSYNSFSAYNVNFNPPYPAVTRAGFGNNKLRKL